MIDDKTQDRRPSTRARSLVAAVAAVACMATVASPALADGGHRDRDRTSTTTSGDQSPPTTRPGDDGSGSTSEPSVPAEPRPTAGDPSSGSKKQGGGDGDGRKKDDSSLLDSLKRGLRHSAVEPALRDALVARLDAAKAAAAGGQPLDETTMQSLIDEVGNALAAASGPTPEHDSDDAGRRSGEVGGDDQDRYGNVDAIRLLDAAADKVASSSLADADKQALLDTIGSARAAVEAGQSLSQDEISQILAAVRAAVGSAGGHGGEPRVAHPEDDGKKPGERALSELDRQIAKVQASDLPDDVKATIVAALEEAKTQIAAGVAAGDDDGGSVAARRAIEEHRQERMATFLERLTGAADRIDARLVELAADPANQAMAEEARVSLDQAREQLALAATPEDLRAVWQLLREIRLSISAVEIPSDTVPPPDTVPPADTAPAPDAGGGF